MNKIIFMTPIMKIVSVEERFSKKTEKPYIVVKAIHYLEKRPLDFMKKKLQKQAITFLCFKENLLCLFEEDNIHLFHGEIEPTWGSTFLHITYLFDDKGRRLLRPQEDDRQDGVERDKVALAMELNEEDENRKREDIDLDPWGFPCDQECDDCEHRNCDNRLPY